MFNLEEYFFLHSFWRITDILIIIKYNQSDNSAFINNQSHRTLNLLEESSLINYCIVHIFLVINMNTQIDWLKIEVTKKEK